MIFHCQCQSIVGDSRGWQCWVEMCRNKDKQSNGDCEENREGNEEDGETVEKVEEVGARATSNATQVVDNST